MKKTIFLMAVMICSLYVWAEPYAMVVGSQTYTLQENGTSQFCNGNCHEYMVLDVALNQGDLITFLDQGQNVGWAITTIEQYGEYAKFSSSAAGITCNVAGCYDLYFKIEYANDRVYIGEGTGCSNDPDPDPDPDPDSDPDPDPDPNPGRPDYASSVPSQCHDVMLQAFYWDSNDANNANAVHGDTKWNTLLAQASEINAYFDMVWLPPSAKSSGGVGYIPSQYSNQNSAWGTRTELEQLIAAFHAGNTKVVADIVINHVGNRSTWCDFNSLDFSPYGTFNPDASWICQNDELNTDASAGSCKGSATGSYDDGYGSESNYAAARDWAHNDAQVRDMCKAYLKWMKNVMMYDGWRYDYCKGFHNSHINDYNSAAKNYFSVMEYWDGNVNTLRERLQDANYNTLTFDFATKYDVLNRGIASGNYASCRGAGMLGAGLSKYAVTFIDSHDSYLRDDNEFCGNGNSMKGSNRAKLLEANAYILSMPGVPCVFYPHWVKYKAQIQPMILARHAAGVHSESTVSDEAGTGYYRATITGTNGSLKLFLGPNSGWNTCPAGYTLAASDFNSNYAIYYQLNTPVAPQLIISPGSQVFKDDVNGLTINMSVVGLNTTGTQIYYTIDGSDPKTSSTKQTYTAPFKITTTTTVKAYAVQNGAETDTQTQTYTYKAPQTGAITVKFRNSGNWAHVYLYAWTTSALLGEWPGTELQAVDGWYSYTFNDAIREVNFIFNGGKGKDQTSDLYTDEDVCYGWSGGLEKLLPDCSYTGVEDVVSANEAISIYPNPVRNTLNINTIQTVQVAEVYDLTGQMQAQSLGANTQLDVSDLKSGMYILRVRNANGTTNSALFLKE